MTRHTERLLHAREQAPAELRGGAFDRWILPLVIASLEPQQADLLEWLLTGEGPAIPTSDLCKLLGKTPEQIGVTVSRLRRLGLVKTHYEQNDTYRYACHDAVEWVKAAYHTAR